MEIGILKKYSNYVSLAILCSGGILTLITACSSINKTVSAQVGNSVDIADCSHKNSRNCYFLNSPVKLNSIGKGFFQLADSMSFIDSKGKQWLAPIRTVTDGASIPAIFIPLLGARTSPEFINAASIHDAYCAEENVHLAQHFSESWEDVHRMLYDALLVNGTSEIKAKIIYAAVYLGGPRWKAPQRSLNSVSRKHLIQEMEWCIKWIKGANPSQKHIERWMKSREKNLQQGNPEQPDWKQLFSEKT